MPTAIFLTLGKMTTQSDWSRIFLDKSPASNCRSTSAELPIRCSSFFWANSEEATAKHSTDTTIPFFIFLSSTIEDGRYLQCCRHYHIDDRIKISKMTDTRT